jgi:hypothetical protein
MCALTHRFGEKVNLTGKDSFTYAKYPCRRTHLLLFPEHHIRVPRNNLSDGCEPSLRKRTELLPKVVDQVRE